MIDVVWMSSIANDARLIKMMSHDMEAKECRTRCWAVDRALEDTGQAPTSIWVDQDQSPIKSLPDLFFVQSSWFVTERLAAVLRQCDLGDGRLSPVEAFQNDHQTPIKGSFAFFTFNNLKAAFLPEESKSLRPYNSVAWSTRAVMNDLDIACSPDALRGPDIWRDRRLYGKVFISTKLHELLSGAKLLKAFEGNMGRVLSCRIVAP